MNGKSWAEDDLAYLREHYPNQPTGAIANHLKRSLSGVYGKALLLGMKKSEAYLNSPQAGRMQKNDKRGGKTRFKKGQAAWNKGIKGLCLGGEKTYFLKGHLPHNTREDGAVSVRKDKRGVPYKFVRLSKGRWVHEQRVLWEQEYGPIEKGMILRSKDGNTLNTAPSNWYLLDRKKNMHKNSGPLNMSDTYVAATLTVRNPELRKELLKHPEIIEVARLNMKLNREINNHKEQR